jgi:plastocyanin
MRVSIGLLAVVALVAAPLLLAPAADAHEITTHVTIAQYAFGPSSLTVHVGDTVVWTNKDTVPHDVTTTSAPVSLHSPTITTGNTWKYTFTVAGTYSYICSIHPDMHARLTVEPAPASSTVTHPSSPVTTTTSAAAGPAVVHRTSAKTSHAPPARTTTLQPRTTARISTPAVAPAAAPTAPTTSGPSLKAMLLLAGLVSAIAVFCLLILAARPEPMGQ